MIFFMRKYSTQNKYYLLFTAIFRNITNETLFYFLYLNFRVCFQFYLQHILNCFSFQDITCSKTKHHLGVTLILYCIMLHTRHLAYFLPIVFLPKKNTSPGYLLAPPRPNLILTCFYKNMTQN